ncbi:hypothetical protein Plhal710r2_c006g0027151 [Plasmopara halstedii]
MRWPCFLACRGSSGQQKSLNFGQQEYGLFHEHHYNILQEWSKSVSN